MGSNAELTWLAHSGELACFPCSQSLPQMNQSRAAYRTHQQPDSECSAGCSLTSQFLMPTEAVCSGRDLHRSHDVHLCYSCPDVYAYAALNVPQFANIPAAIVHSPAYVQTEPAIGTEPAATRNDMPWGYVSCESAPLPSADHVFTTLACGKQVSAGPPHEGHERARRHLDKLDAAPHSSAMILHSQWSGAAAVRISAIPRLLAQQQHCRRYKGRRCYHRAPPHAAAARQ